MNKNTNTSLGLLAGLATGALLGILFAPEKGNKTRKIIKKKIEETGSNVIEEAQIIKNNVANTIKYKKETLEEQLDNIVSSTSHKAEDLINSLERQLEILKEKNKKVQKS